MKTCQLVLPLLGITLWLGACEKRETGSGADTTSYQSPGSEVPEREVMQDSARATGDTVPQARP